MNHIHKIGDVNASQDELVEASEHFFLLLYGQKDALNINHARCKIFEQKKKKPSLKALPPTKANLLQHALRAHLQVILWMSANQKNPPEMTIDITKFGWSTKHGIMPVIAQQLIAPEALLDITSCGCRSEGKACSLKKL